MCGGVANSKIGRLKKPTGGKSILSSQMETQ